MGASGGGDAVTVDIQRLRELLASATPGPYSTYQASAFERIEVNAPTRTVAMMPYDHRPGEREPDAHLICAAINALPQLLAIAEAAEKWRDWTAPIEWDPHEQALIDAVDGKKGTMSQPDLYWHCVSCGGHEPAQTPYVLGDSEPCIACENGVARVMTTKEAAAAEQQVALGNAARKERT